MSHSEEVTLTEAAEHVRITTTDSVSEPIDPRISPTHIASSAQLDTPSFEKTTTLNDEEKQSKHVEKVAVEKADSDSEEGGGEGPLYVCRETRVKKRRRGVDESIRRLNLNRATHATLKTLRRRVNGRLRSPPSRLPRSQVRVAALSRSFAFDRYTVCRC